MSPIYDPKRHHQILLVVVPSAPSALPVAVACLAGVLVVYLPGQATGLIVYFMPEKLNPSTAVRIP